MVVDMTRLVYSHPTFRDYADLSAQGIKVLPYGGRDIYMKEFEDGTEDILTAAGTITDLLHKVLPNVR